MFRALLVILTLPFAPWTRGVPPGGKGTDGVGYAYPEDPTRGPYALVALRELTGEGLRLEGRYVRVRSARIDPGVSMSAMANAPDFRYEPSEEGPDRCTLDLSACAPFDAVNVYYHVDRMAREFWSARLGIEIGFQATATVHLAGNGALADPGSRRLLFRMGDTYSRNSAREDDMIYHEYSHLVTSDLGFKVDTSAAMPARAVNEGYADYFAATFTNDPGIGEYVKACTPRFHCQGPEDDPDVRTLATRADLWNWNGGRPNADLKYGVCTRYHEGDGKCKVIYLNTAAVYVWGMIWGSTLWDIRTALGADVADRLALESVRRLNPATTRIESAAGAMLVADRALHGGAFAERLIALFAARGILPERSTLVSLESSGTVADLRRAELRFFPNPARALVRLRADGIHRVEVFDAAGGFVDVPVSIDDDLVSIDFSAAPPGRYWVRAWNGRSSRTGSVVVAR